MGLHHLFLYCYPLCATIHVYLSLIDKEIIPFSQQSRVGESDRVLRGNVRAWIEGYDTRSVRDRCAKKGRDEREEKLVVIQERITEHSF